MQKSRSILSFGSNTEYTELLHQPKPQRRSSLDTLVIPGRIRLPSSKASQASQASQDSADIQVAQTLLNQSVMAGSKSAGIKLTPHNSDEDASSPKSRRSPMSRSGSKRHSNAPKFTTRPIKRTSRTQIQHRRDLAAIRPGCIRETETYPTRSPHSSTNNIVDPFLDPTDGPSDAAESRHFPRVVSSSLSPVSHRVVSNSSAGSRVSRASEFRIEYNVRAEQHGLPLLKDETSGMSSHINKTMVEPNDLPDKESSSSQSKMTKHHHSWFSRKFLHRSSSTFSLEPKATNKALAHQKSFGGFHLLGRTSHTNVLKDQPLEETCRLGGLGTLNLPPEFAIHKLYLPTSLSLMASQLLEHGASSFTPPFQCQSLC